MVAEDHLANEGKYIGVKIFLTNNAHDLQEEEEVTSQNPMTSWKCIEYISLTKCYSLAIQRTVGK